MAKELANNKTVGWFQGGWNSTKSLGGRSILADPRSDKMQKIESKDQV